jgi:NHL repeat
MSAGRIINRAMLTMAPVLFLVLALSGGAYAAPVKLVLSSHFGREVNLTEVSAKGGPALEDVCTVESKAECQDAKESTIQGGFSYPQGVAAGGPNGNIYIADEKNGRVQELTPEGLFVLMFGKDVDATTGGDVCTAASKDTCQAGVKGTTPGQLDESYSIAVDPVSGDVYVAEVMEKTFGQRVQKFTPEGTFLLEIGKQVNNKTKANLCTEEELANCAEPTREAVGTSEHGSFNFAVAGNILAVGGEHDLLYVGDEHRVQEFEADGQWQGEIPLTAISSEVENKVTALTVNDKTGAVFLVYGRAAAYNSIIRSFDADGKELATFEMTPRESGIRVKIESMALDSEGHLALTATELEKGQFGSLYDSASDLRITDFSIRGGAVVHSIAFDAENKLYAAAAESAGEILTYSPEPVAELRTGAAICKEGPERETAVTFNCALNGEVNPYNVAKTNVWFEWGATCALGSETPMQEVATLEALLPVSASIEDLRPKVPFCYRLAGDDENLQSPEQLEGAKEGERSPLSTPTVPPKVIGQPSASFVKSSSAVMYGELNPENTPTEYFFEYAPVEALAKCPAGIKQESCPEVAVATVLQSSLYGRMGAASEASGLQPGTSYGFRLAADNEAGAAPMGMVGSFTTAPPPEVNAETGSFGAVTTTSALVSGTVSPDGQPATYMFEIGIYRGTATQYGTVFSGATGTTTEVETLPLTGLQPGTEYAYRIKIASGYGTATGVTVVFKTEGSPIVLPPPTSLPMLPVSLHFENKKPGLSACKKGYRRSKQDKCVKVKKKTKPKAGGKKAHKKKK